MKTILKIFSVLLLSTIVNASSSWIPITMGDILSFVPSVSISPALNTYPVNATVSVNVNGTLSNNKDWIGIFKKGTQKKWGNQIAWNFVDGKSRVALTRNKLAMPAGEYEVALFFNNSLNRVESTASFKVEGESRVYPPETILAPRTTDINVAPPQVDAPIIDTVFHTRIYKIDKVDSGLSPYPKVQAWNKDETLLRISNRLYDAKTLKESEVTKGKPNSSSNFCDYVSSYFRWSNVSANTFYVIDSSYQLIKGTVNQNTIDCTTLDTFGDYEEVHIGPYEGNIDYNDKYVVFVAKKEGDTTLYVILYDLQAKSRVWTKTMPTQHWFWKTDEKGDSYWAPSTLDWLSVSPSGRYIVFNNANGYTDGSYRYDINLRNKIKLQYLWTNGNLYSEGGHGDMGYDTDGNEVYVEFLAGVGVYSFNLDNPTELGKELLSSPYGGGHISCRNSKRPGWCYVTANNDSNGYGLRRVFSLKIDGTGNEIVENFSQTHINTNYQEAYGSPSPDGTKMIFNSHWGTNTIGTYVVEAQ